MKSKGLFQVFVLLALLLSPFGANQAVRASTSAVEDIQKIDRNFLVLQDQPTVSLVVSPSSVNLGGTANVMVSLNHVPAEGYTSAELTCYYASNLVEASNVVVADRFGPDPALAVSHYIDRFIVAIAGSQGNRATTDGVVLTFDLRGRQPGQAQVECQARVSKGDHELTPIASTGGNVMVLAATVTPTFRPTPCDKAEFIADINVPPGTVMSPGTQFTKTWRLKNVGTCTWTPSYRMALFSGDQMGAPSSIQIPVNVAPGQTVDLSLRMTAPLANGSYRGYWIFQNFTGSPFGAGSQGNEPWFVDIVVTDATVTPAFTQPSNILKLTKSPSPQTYSALDQTITYTFTITNTGTTPLGPAQFTITDNKLGAPFNCGPANVTLALSQSVTCSMVYQITSADMELANITNSATAAGAGQVSAPATAVVTNLVAPATSTPSITPGELTHTSTQSNTPGGPTATPVPGTVYDFAANACAATWSSGAGGLPCPGEDGDPRGFVLRLSNPQLETGAIDTRPGLLTFPQNVQNGYIQGVYPPFHVQNGDRFRSIIGCEAGATNCYLAFRLDYQVGSDPIKIFWGPFLERYDGRSYSIDVDLSRLAGNDVKFVLTVLSAGVATGDRALWVGPIISRANAVPTATSEPATATPSESLTPAFTFTPVESPVPTSTPSGGGLLTGRVFASKLVTINVYDADHTVVGSGWVNPDGTFNLNASIGTNKVIASANGFLSAQRSVTITDGSKITLPTITLIEGDIDGNNVIDQFDAMTIGMSYNTASPSAADLNNDEIINVLDLELLARNYRKTGPVDWQ